MVRVNFYLRKRGKAESASPPTHFPLKCCISIAYKVKKRVVPYLYRFLEPLQTLYRPFPNPVKLEKTHPKAVNKPKFKDLFYC